LLPAVPAPAQDAETPPASAAESAGGGQDGGSPAQKAAAAPQEPPPPVPDWIISVSAATVFFNEDGGIQTAPAPVIGMPCFSFDWMLMKKGRVNLALEAGLGVYWAYYLLHNGRPYPAEIENRQSFVLGFIPGVQAKLIIPLAKFMLHTSLGFTADMRVVSEAPGLGEPEIPEAREQTGAIRDYFWENARFLYPSFELGFDYPIVKNWRLGLRVVVYCPLVQMLRNETAGFEAWRFGAALSVSRHLQKKEKPETKKPETKKTVQRQANPPPPVQGGWLPYY
jgi:hypothetical protein